MFPRISMPVVLIHPLPQNLQKMCGLQPASPLQRFLDRSQVQGPSQLNLPLAPRPSTTWFNDHELCQCIWEFAAKARGRATGYQYWGGEEEE